MNRHTSTRDLSELRLQLVECARSLRHYRDNLDMVKALAEQTAIECGKASGKNAEERARLLTIALISDDGYTSAIAMLRDAEYAHERAEALVKCAEDERRAAELDARNARTNAYQRLAMQRDRPEYAGVDQDDDDQIDDNREHYLDRMLGVDLDF